MEKENELKIGDKFTYMGGVWHIVNFSDDDTVYLEGEPLINGLPAFMEVPIKKLMTNYYTTIK